MGVWFAVPSIRPGGGTIPIWRERGYRIAVLRQGESLGALADIEVLTGVYIGWAKSVNILAHYIITRRPGAQWVVTGGDDTLPDPNHSPDEIAAQCETYFGSRDPGHATFGVMQPTGDRWGDDAASRARWGEDRGAMIDRIAGSPWMGREWCERAYGGNGPMWAAHYHCFADEELQEVAIREGVFWQRRDLTHYHDHAVRNELNNRVPDSPEAAASWAIAQRDYREGRALFEERKRAGFPGSKPK